MENRELDSRRWMILAASCLVNLCIGSLYAWSVFVRPMAERLTTTTGQEVTNLAIVFTLANAVGPITMISGGAIVDRIGPKWVIRMGGILFGVGMIASGFATSVAWLLVTYGLGVGLGVGMVYGATVSNAVKFFPDRRGLVGGIATASYGISSVIVPIIANALTSVRGITQSFVIIGAAMLVAILAASIVIEACPQGYAPSSWQASLTTVSAPIFDLSWRYMLREPSFWMMISMLLCGAFSGLMITSQASPMAQDMVGMDASSAALVVSTLAVFNTLGRLVAGAASDRLGAVGTIRLVFVSSIAGLVLLSFAGSGHSVPFVAGVCMVGFAFGSIMGIYPGFTASQFGAKNNSVNYGIMFIGFAVAGFFGPTIMTMLYGAFGSYLPAFFTAMVLAIAGLVLTFVFQCQQSHVKTH
ncbi:MAG: OFA family MFS transporter [Atopobiaceae bacterium]|nr:OFA family MFS transporter [Atopobiaceae bacterium]